MISRTEGGAARPAILPAAAVDGGHVRLLGEGDPIPAETLCGMKAGDKVSVLVQDGSLLVVGNLSQPADGTVWATDGGYAVINAEKLRMYAGTLGYDFDVQTEMYVQPQNVLFTVFDDTTFHESYVQVGKDKVALFCGIDQDGMRNGITVSDDGVELAGNIKNLKAWTPIASTPVEAHNLAITDRSRFREADGLVDLNIWVRSMKTTSALSAGQPFKICTLPEWCRPPAATTLTASIASTGTLAHVFSAYTGASGAVYLRDHTALNNGVTLNNVVICGQFFKE